MGSCLIVLNPRQIPQCIESIEALDIDKLWISNMDEPSAADAINEAIREDQDHLRYVVISDDCVVPQIALDAVLDLHAKGNHVTTGYCNLDATSRFCNLTDHPLVPPPPSAADYRFMLTDKVRRNRRPIQTTFAGLALTCMHRDMWLQFPIGVTEKKRQMDYDLSYRLQRAGYRIMVPPLGFVYHVKERWNKLDRAPEKQLLIGRRRAEVRWDPR